MLRLDADDLAQTAERILQVDKMRLVSDAFKLPDWLRLLVETRLTAYRAATRDLRTASGSRSNQSERSVCAMGTSSSVVCRTSVSQRTRSLRHFRAMDLPAAKSVSFRKKSALLSWHASRLMFRLLSSPSPHATLRIFSTRYARSWIFWRRQSPARGLECAQLPRKFGAMPSKTSAAP
jgi:hypothetical protein